MNDGVQEIRGQGRTARLDRDGEIRLAAGEPFALGLAEGGHWYGHGFNHVQPYPLEAGSIANDAFAVNNIQCPVWMASRGFVLYAETDEPLVVRLNADGDGRLVIACPGAPLTLRVFRDRTLPAAHRRWLRHLGWPSPPPAPDRFGESLFCTWTQYPRCLTQKRVLDMARQIRARGYPCRTLIVDDRWESAFGELTFAPANFPDPRAMFQELHRLGFEVWLWVTPFVNVEAPSFVARARNGELVGRRGGTGAALLKWWGGTAGLVDLTGKPGRTAFIARLRALLDLGADGFKIDGGDAKYHPPAADCVWARAPGASGYADRLLAVFEELVPHRCETRTAWRSQSRRILWREGGKDSHWGLDNGLKAMVFLGQHLGLMGYDLLIPDMVPGRVQTMNASDTLATDELMARWTEASLFFPFVQFSYFPWNYGEATAEAVRSLAWAHATLRDYLAEQTAGRSAPLLRPLWYDAPDDPSLYALADEFMLGTDLVVAPVLDPGVARRDVRLPPGEWVDAWTGDAVCGFLKDWPAPCPGIPVFRRVGGKRRWAAFEEALRGVRRGSVPTGVTTAQYRAGLDRDLRVTG